MRIQNKVAIITGGASGIGRETAILFAKEGAKVIIIDLPSANFDEVTSQINSNNGDIDYYAADVTNEVEIKIVINQIIEKYGQIDILFNNAGISGVGKLHEIDMDMARRVFEVNITGVFIVSKYVLQQMMKQREGNIINMSSCIAEIGLADRAPYAASKGAVMALTKSMQVDYAEYGIRINALLPGTIYTPFVEDYLSREADRDKAIQIIKGRQLSGELGLPIDVAYAALYLASNESKFMMGSPLHIDGGTVFGKKVLSK